MIPNFILSSWSEVQKFGKTEKNTFFKIGPAHGWSTLGPKLFGNHQKTYQAIFSEG